MTALAIGATIVALFLVTRLTAFDSPRSRKLEALKQCDQGRHEFGECYRKNELQTRRCMHCGYERFF